MIYISIDDIDDEHGDFDAFSPRPQYLAFFFDGGELDDKGPLLLDWFSAYTIFFYSVHVLTLVIEVYDWMKKVL